ncbi:origin recognition complex subunit 2 [Capsaspora owczarzaki ATCC 30864]|uniref:origin recognition complex subunit 2 n=1 Tax=Capsaspora owczarzaki (strain ATCC 30864) TaxID=595528 RepID=UPI0001FE6317|nr:origin recognition complex subunit 2 [Capsaspora owczarzaki ATCC 30864]|eukprot:XP_004365014.1 origin recognition complex subunit 2 [Capsaspora owczarzaki ATCC 30864]
MQDSPSSHHQKALKSGFLAAEDEKDQAQQALQGVPLLTASASMSSRAAASGGSLARRLGGGGAAIAPTTPVKVASGQVPQTPPNKPALAAPLPLLSEDSSRKRPRLSAMDSDDDSEQDSADRFQRETNRRNATALANPLVDNAETPRRREQHQREQAPVEELPDSRMQQGTRKIASRAAKQVAQKQLSQMHSPTGAVLQRVIPRGQARGSPKPPTAQLSSKAASSGKQATEAPSAATRHDESSSESEDEEALFDDENEDEEEEEDLQRYFHDHNKSDLTSNNTLAHLKGVDEETLASAIKRLPEQMVEERNLLRAQLALQFPRWMFELQNNFNLLLYGLGSKRRIMRDFASAILPDACQLFVNGYFPGLTIRHILAQLTEGVLNCYDTFRTPFEQCDYIRRTFALAESDTTIPRHVYLFINNIEGPGLRNEKAQAILASLASLPQFHLIASIDHVNAPLIWDNEKVGRFSWIWHDATTYDPYQHETSYEHSLAGLLSATGSTGVGHTNVRGVMHVLKSLTPNARSIFKLLLTYQLDEGEEAEVLLDCVAVVFPGFPFHAFYKLCRERFLVNSDLTLRTQLTEFRDHEMIRSRKGTDGLEYLSVPMSTTLMKNVLEAINTTK